MPIQHSSTVDSRRGCHSYSADQLSSAPLVPHRWPARKAATHPAALQHAAGTHGPGRVALSGTTASSVRSIHLSSAASRAAGTAAAATAATCGAALLPARRPCSLRCNTRCDGACGRLLGVVPASRRSRTPPATRGARGDGVGPALCWTVQSNIYQHAFCDAMCTHRAAAPVQRPWR